MNGELKKDLVIGLLVAILAFLVYGNSLGNGFVIDDTGIILENPALHHTVLSLFSAVDASSRTQPNPFYRPFTYLTFSLEGQLHGHNPFLMHLVNVLLHAVSAFLVYWLGRTLFDERFPAMMAGLIFAVHPINAESVNFLSGGRNTILASFFVLLAYLIHHKSMSSRSIASAYLSAGFLLAGMLSKEIAIMLLPIILACELISNTSEADARFKKVLRLTPFALALVCYLVLRWSALSDAGVQIGFLPGSGGLKLGELYIIPGFAERMMNTIYSIPKYLSLIVWPAALSPRYLIPADFHAIRPQLIAGWVVIVAGVLLILKQDNNKASIFGLAWFVAFWIPVSGILYFSMIEMADRYMYLPAVGLWMIIAGLFKHLVRDRRRVLRSAAIASATLILIAFAVMTIQRNTDWKSDLTLFSRMAEQYPENPYAFYHLGSAYLTRNEPDDLRVAEEHLKKALALDPATQFVQPQLGYIRLMRGDPDEALHYLNEALRLSPHHREARMNRGIAYEQIGKNKEALADYEYYLNIPGDNDLPGSREYAQERVRALAP